MTEKPPEASWLVFEECTTCGTGEGQPCYNLRVSTSRKLIENYNPHPGRKMKARKSRPKKQELTNCPSCGFKLNDDVT